MNTPSPNETMTHKRQLFNHLLAGKSITPLQALNEYKCMSCSQRLGDLRRDYGIPIQSKFITVASGKRVKQYWLEPNYITFVKQNQLDPLECKV